MQFSTDNLIGRKLFVWGTESQGGRTWNRWLSHDDRYYAETQAGLLHSQAEQRPMAGKTSVEWTEGYAALTGEPTLFGNADNRISSAYTENILTLAGRFDLVKNADAYFEAAGEWEIFTYGSGWGALTELYTGGRLSSLVPFPRESIAEDAPEHDFLVLYETGRLPEKSSLLAEDYPIDYAGGAAGGAILERLEAIPEKSWYAWLEIGCLYYERKSFNAAEAALRKSLAVRENALALTALAKLAAARGRGASEGVGLMKRALALGGEYVRLVIDAAAYLRAHGTPEDADEAIRAGVAAHPGYLDNGRIALLYIQNLVKQGRLDEAEALLLKVPEVADMREGEVSTSAVWIELYRQKIAREEGRDAGEIPADEVLRRHPVPAEIDFRMSGYEVH